MAGDQEKIIVYVDSDLEDLIPVFLENRQKDIKELSDALAEGDLEKIRVIGHTLKGIGGGYGFDRITEIGASLERAAKENRKNEIEKLLKDFKDFLDRVEVRYEE